MEGANNFTHGFTFGGHPVCAAIALANLDALESEGVLENVRAHEADFRAMLESLRDLPIVGDVRGGAGYFQAVELVKDRDSKESFDEEESETLLRGFLSGELYRRGLICRADDRGDPVIQLSPPPDQQAGPEQFEEIEGILEASPRGGRTADARPQRKGCSRSADRTRRLIADEDRRPDRGQGGRVPGRIDPRWRARAGRCRARGVRPAGRRRRARRIEDDHYTAQGAQSVVGAQALFAAARIWS